MPAYRSSDEAEIRECVVSRLREILPEGRIIHEINCAGIGSNRIDVISVGKSEIYAVEIKSKKDKLDRLPDQLRAMRLITQNSISAIHEKFLRNERYGFYPPEESMHSPVWVYPKRDRIIDGNTLQHVYVGKEWLKKPRHINTKNKNLEQGAIRMLWRDELQEIVAGLGLRKVKSLTVDQAIDEIRWHMTGNDITHAICRSLRNRSCIEADPEIFE